LVSENRGKGRLLGLDYGTVRIGLAITDPDRIVASPLATYTRQSPPIDAMFFAKTIKEYDVVALVVGLPIHSDGKESEKSREARVFGAWLSELTQLPVVFWDERFSTVRAEEALLSAKLNPRERKSKRDRVAAQMILQAYLDAGCPAKGTESQTDLPTLESDHEDSR
jgi:putative holliday junction resolvase